VLAGTSAGGCVSLANGKDTLLPRRKCLKTRHFQRRSVFATSPGPPGTNAPGADSWAVKTVTGNPDGSSDTTYSNYLGEVLLQDHYDPAAGLHWDHYYAYDGSGQVTLDAAPSAVTGYSDSYADLLNNQSGSYLSNSSGLITRYDYYTTNTATETAAGSVAGYRQDVKVQQGQQGTLVTQESWQYYAHSAGGQTVAPVASDTVYRNTDGSGAETTSYTTTLGSWHSVMAGGYSGTHLFNTNIMKTLRRFKSSGQR
jgi:hypothetical protein